MDSLTQITLGAAVGEVVLGRRVGNKAMIWGAIAGTIPDLDILADFATDNISATAFHRGITHSIPFAIIAPFALGWLVHRLYGQEWSKSKLAFRDLGGVYLFLVVLCSIGAAVLPIPFGDVLPIGAVVSAGIVGFVMVSWVYRRTRKLGAIEGNPSWRAWSWLFFWGIFTHPMLDACTAYGTQLFQPFSDFRVNWNTISVVDPIYTIPFLICVIIASRLTRHSPKRAWFNRVGIALSSAYLLFTVFNKVRTDRIFERSFVEQNIDYQRYTSSPTIFNNILWQAVAETDTAYFEGRYSLFDTQKRVRHFGHLPKNHELLAPYQNQRVVEILKWFSDDYYNVSMRGDTLQFNNLKYGTISYDLEEDEEPKYIFSFRFKDENGQLVQLPSEFERDPDAFGKLWERLKGVE
ncbi:MAG: metal-dependent hydrolase [Bacteroidota bacterium]